MRQIKIGTITCLLVMASLAQADLADPVRITAAGKPIDTAIGHAAPYVTDMNGDGVRDLLVGQFGDGILRIFKNLGTNTEPNFAAGEEFQTTKGAGRVPSG